MIQEGNPSKWRSLHLLDNLTRARGFANAFLLVATRHYYRTTLSSLEARSAANRLVANSPCIIHRLTNQILAWLISQGTGALSFGQV